MLRLGCYNCWGNFIQILRGDEYFVRSEKDSRISLCNIKKGQRIISLNRTSLVPYRVLLCHLYYYNAFV